MAEITKAIDDIINIIERAQIKNSAAKQTIINSLDYSSDEYQSLFKFCTDLHSDFRVILLALDDISNKNKIMQSGLNEYMRLIDTLNFKINEHERSEYNYQSSLNESRHELSKLIESYSILKQENKLLLQRLNEPRITKSNHLQTCPTLSDYFPELSPMKNQLNYAAELNYDYDRDIHNEVIKNYACSTNLCLLNKDNNYYQDKKLNQSFDVKQSSYELTSIANKTYGNGERYANQYKHSIMSNQTTQNDKEDIDLTQRKSSTQNNANHYANTYIDSQMTDIIKENNQLDVNDYKNATNEVNNTDSLRKTKHENNNDQSTDDNLRQIIDLPSNQINMIKEGDDVVSALENQGVFNNEDFKQGSTEKHLLSHQNNEDDDTINKEVDKNIDSNQENKDLIKSFENQPYLSSENNINSSSNQNEFNAHLINNERLTFSSKDPYLFSNPNDCNTHQLTNDHSKKSNQIIASDNQNNEISKFNNSNNNNNNVNSISNQIKYNGNDNANVPKQKYERIHNIVLKAFRNEKTIRALKAKLGNNFEDKLIQGDINEEYINKVEQILNDLENKKKDIKPITHQAKRKNSKVKKILIDDSDWRRYQMQQQLIDKTYRFREYPRGWTSTKDYFVNNSPMIQPMSKSIEKITTFIPH